MTQGFVVSLCALGELRLVISCYTQICRRAQQLEILLRRATQHQGPIDIVVDSTGMKVYGEGEWKVRQHGASKRRTWKKLHIAVDPVSHEIVGSALTESKVTDEQMPPFY